MIVLVVYSSEADTDFGGKSELDNRYVSSSETTKLKLTFVHHVITCPAPIMGPGACHFVVTKMKEGLKQWLIGKSSRWEGPISHAADVVGNSMFEAYLNQMDIGWDHKRSKENKSIVGSCNGYS